MQGRIDIDTLKRMVADDEIDTVVAAFPDMYGRLVGKRILGRFFVDEVIAHGLHACDYLLACDMEMDPVPGYAFTSWAKGYGDFRPIPDFETLRIASWLERTALVLCDVYREDRRELVPLAPRSILRRQLARAAERGYSVMAASELELYLFKDSYEQIVERRVGAGAAGNWPSVRRGAGDGGPALDLQARGEGDRVAAGARGHVHGEVGRAPRGIELPHPHEFVGRARQEGAVRRHAVRHVPLVPRRMDEAHPRALRVLRAVPVVVQALRGGLVRADRHRLVARQPHGRLPHRRPRAVAAHRVPRAGRGRERVSRLRRGARRGTRGDRASRRAAAGVRR